MNPDIKRAYKLPCCIEAPESFAQKAQYALQMLLMPLNIAPVWVSRGSLDTTGVYYGEESSALPENVLHIPLQEHTVDYFSDKRPYDPSMIAWRKSEQGRFPVLFPGAVPESDDVVASAFFWLSGWQEYTISNRDQHGRFSYTDSLQSVLNIVETPIVDCYRQALRRLLLARNVPIQQRRWGDATWAFCATHDIDYLWKWRPGMMYREVVEHLVLNQRGEGAAKRLGRFGHFVSDLVKPKDIFRKALDRMIDEVAERDGKATYFFKTGAHGPHDVFYHPKNRYLKKVMDRLRNLKFEAGLHPSYYAHTHPQYLNEEKEALERAWGGELTSIRQHYLRYEAPHTMRLQEVVGFKIDSTLAFADHEGFRNGTCHPFKRFDITKNTPGAAWEMPLCFMDGTLFNYRKLDVNEAVHVSEKLMATCRQFGGVCVGLWHNTLWDEMDFPGWGDHFLKILDEAQAQNGGIHSLRNALSSYFA